MQRYDIHISQEAIGDFCRRHGIVRLSLFGSIVRDDFGPESDVDVLVEFHPGRTPGMFAFAGMQMELRALLGDRRPVDLRTAEDLSRYFRDEVVRSAELQYAA